MNQPPDPPAPPPRAACLPDEALSAWAERSLDDDLRAAVEAHLAACDSCRMLALDLTEDAGAAQGLDRPQAPPAPPSSVRRTPLLGGLAAAAVLLLAVGAWLWVSALPRARPPVEDADLLLASIASNLVRERPDLFGDFTPLSPAERATDPTPTRGGLRIHEPAGPTETDRPTFRWQGVAAGGPVTVAVLRDDGTRVWSRSVQGTSLAYPAEEAPLAPGSAYLAEVATAGPLGPVSGTRGFRVVTEDERRRLEEALRVLAARTPSHLASLAAAHYLLRQGFTARAEAAARDHLAARPGDPHATTLLAHVRALRGEP